jgi:hypothetical protein
MKSPTRGDLACQVPLLGANVLGATDREGLASNEPCWGAKTGHAASAASGQMVRRWLLVARRGQTSGALRAGVHERVVCREAKVVVSRHCHGQGGSDVMVVVI